MAQKINPFSHVADNNHIEVFETMGWVIELPNLHVFGHDVPIKFMLLMAVCALGVGGAMIWLGGKMKNGDAPRGYLWNLLESLLFFVRDKIARPGVGEHDADKYLPYLTTLFLFIFAMNLIGMIPFLASPTAAMITPPIDGPITRLRFTIDELSAMALGRSARSPTISTT